MTGELLVAIVLAVLLVAGGLLAIHHWGPRVSRRLVKCPEKKMNAAIEVERREGSFGALLEDDVASCSLLPEGQVECDRACIHPHAEPTPLK